MATAIVITGMGFFTDAYNLFCISLVTNLLGRIYYYNPNSDIPGKLPPNVAQVVNGVVSCGSLAGQLFFGWLGDKMDRKRVYGITLMLMVVCSIFSGLSFGHTAKGVMTTLYFLYFFRLWLGFGIGGYNATMMSEYADKRTHGAFIAVVFAMRGLGALIVSAAFKSGYKAPPYEIDGAGSTVADYVWRIILMVSAIPAVLTYYWRMNMLESARYTALVAKNVKQATADMTTVLQVEIVAEQETTVLQVEIVAEQEKVVSPAGNFGLFSKEFARCHGLHLVGTASTWFLLDTAMALQKDIFSASGCILRAKTMNTIEEVFKVALVQTLVALCGAIAGYCFTVALIMIFGRFKTQLIGFFMMTAFLLGLAIPYHHWKSHHIGFSVMYTLTFFFANFGPNSTTFIVPIEIFPARLRSTCHGISAAAGKAGAIVGAFGFFYAAQDQDKSKTDPGYPAGIGNKNSLFLLAGFYLVAFFLTFLVPESKEKSLEEMSEGNEDENQTAEPVPA